MPRAVNTTHEDVARFLQRGDFTAGEKSLVEWQFRLHGDFWSALWLAISKADALNQARLAAGFPGEVEAYREWAYGGLGDRIRAAGLMV